MGASFSLTTQLMSYDDMTFNTTKLSFAALSIFCFASVGCSSLMQMAQGAGGTGGAGGEAEQKQDLSNIPDPEPNAELRKSLLKCNSSVTPGDVLSGRVGEYKFTEGMNTDERTGFLDRKPIEMTDGCFLGEFKPGECAAWTVNEENYKALGNSNDWEVQCVYSDDPGAGVIKNKGEFPYTLDRMNPHYFMLMCNHDQDESYQCHEGSNSARGGKWREQLDAQGKVQLGFCAPESLVYQETSYEDKDYPKGRWVYCQYYNKQSNESMAGFEFLQTVTNL